MEKRIELTQFKKSKNGEYKVEASIGDHTRYMYEDEYSIALSKQLNALPALIDELKRTYEEIDILKRNYRSCNQSLIHTTEWNVRMQNAIDSGKMSEIKRVRNS